MSQQFSGQQEFTPSRGQAGVTHYMRYWHDIFSGSILFGGVLATGKVRLVPIQLYFAMTVDRLAFIDAFPPAGNHRYGIYADNGDTPAGGALLGETASVAVGFNKTELAIGPLSLPAGLYWIAHQNDDGTLMCYYHNIIEALGGTLETKFFNQVYGAFTNPCPAVASEPDVCPWVYARIASVP